MASLVRAMVGSLLVGVVGRGQWKIGIGALEQRVGVVADVVVHGVGHAAGTRRRSAGRARTTRAACSCARPRSRCRGARRRPPRRRSPRRGSRRRRRRVREAGMPNTSAKICMNSGLLGAAARHDDLVERDAQLVAHRVDVELHRQRDRLEDRAVHVAAGVAGVEAEHHALAERLVGGGQPVEHRHQAVAAGGHRAPPRARGTARAISPSDTARSATSSPSRSRNQVRVHMPRRTPLLS